MIFKRNTYRKLPDEELMRKVASGNTHAFSELYDRYSNPLINYFYKMLWKERETAEDFMQELFTKIIDRPELFDTSRCFKTWIYSVANNMCKNEYRKREVRSNTVNGLDETYRVREHSVNQAKFTDETMFKTKLGQELDKLEEVQKQTFILRFKHELSIREIAEIMECSEGTVKSRVFYTIKRLAANLEEFRPGVLSFLLLVLLN
ncbi:MAG: RNA polymerase sigma factor [Flavobacteriales bacterium]